MAETTTIVKVEQQYEVPDKIVEDVFLDGYLLTHAIGYWAYDYYLPGGRLFHVEWQAEEGNPKSLTGRTLSYGEIARAAGEVAFGRKDLDIAPVYRGYVANFFRELMEGERFPGGDVDSEVADIVIQTALFGKVIYG